MMFALITYPTHHTILCLSERKHFAQLHLRYNVQEVSAPPSKRTLQRWVKNGRARATCGCWVNTDKGARCPTHNKQSWLTVYYKKVVELYKR
jgi:shikimate 5-dehydrogenase